MERAVEESPRNFFLWIIVNLRNILRACETLGSAREIASVALSTEREKHTENVKARIIRLGAL